MLSPVPGATAMPDAVRPTTSAGVATRGTARSTPSVAWWSRSGRYSRVPADQYPVPDASPASVVHPLRSPPSAARMRPVSQSWGSTHVRARARLSGSCRATQRSLLTVVAATGTTPVASAQACAPSSPTRSAAASAERVSFHSRAGRTTSSASSSRTMPCCWPPTARADDTLEQPSGRRLLPGRPPVAGVDLGAVRVRRPPGAHHLAGVGVADDDLARLGRGVDPGDELTVGMRVLPDGGGGCSTRRRPWHGIRRRRGRGGGGEGSRAHRTSAEHPAAGTRLSAARQGSTSSTARCASDGVARGCRGWPRRCRPVP